MPQNDAHDFLFLIEGISEAGRRFDMTGEEHNHLSRVLRKQVGDEVYVTDGRGRIVRCRILEIGRDLSRLEPLGQVPVQVRRQSLALALACIRKERFERALAQCTELGVTRFIPFLSHKTRLKSYPDNFIKRLNKIMQAAMKQSFQAFLPAIDPVMSFHDLAGLVESTALTVVGESDAPPFCRPRQTGSILLVIGPEGGFTEPERDELAGAGATFASSSTARLRSETAAVSMASVILALTD
jgi:16S rRNA (uracil1498-N3)-methyltransferase